MKRAISNIGWSEREDSLIYGLMNKYGFKGLEIAPTRFFPDPYNRDDQELLKLKQSFEILGISLVSMQSLHFGKSGIKLFGTQEERDTLMEYTKQAICFASKLKIDTLVFGSPQIRVINNVDKEYQIAIEFFRELGQFSEAHNTHLCIEANPVEYKTNFINTSQEALDLVRWVDTEGFKMNYDLSTVIINHESIDILEEAAKFIQHVHISEPFLEATLKNHTPLHLELKNTLDKIHYKNWISIEMKKVSEESNKDQIERSLEYISEIFGG